MEDISKRFRAVVMYVQKLCLILNIFVGRYNSGLTQNSLSICGGQFSNISTIYDQTSQITASLQNACGSGIFGSGATNLGSTIAIMTSVRFRTSKGEKYFTKSQKEYVRRDLINLKERIRRKEDIYRNKLQSIYTVNEPISQLNKFCGKLTIKVNDVEQQFEMTKLSLEKMYTNHREISSKMQKCVSDCEVFQIKVKDLEIMEQNLNTEIAHYTFQNGNLFNSIEVNKVKVAEFEKTIKESNEKLADIKNEANTLNVKLNAQNSLITESTKVLAENSAIRDDKIVNIRKIDGDMERTESLIEGELQKQKLIMDKMDVLDSKIRNHEIDDENHKKDMESRKREFDCDYLILMKKPENLKMESESVEMNINKKVAENSKLMVELVSLKSIKPTLVAKQTEYDCLLRELNNENGGLLNQIEGKQNEIINLKEEINNNEASCASLEAQNVDLDVMLEKLTTTAAEYEDKCNEYCNSEEIELYQKLQTEQKSLEKELEELDKLLRDKKLKSMLYSLSQNENKNKNKNKNKVENQNKTKNESQNLSSERMQDFQNNPNKRPTQETPTNEFASNSVLPERAIKKIKRRLSIMSNASSVSSSSSKAPVGQKQINVDFSSDNSSLTWEVIRRKRSPSVKLPASQGNRSKDEKVDSSTNQIRSSTPFNPLNPFNIPGYVMKPHLIVQRKPSPEKLKDNRPINYDESSDGGQSFLWEM